MSGAHAGDNDRPTTEAAMIGGLPKNRTQTNRMRASVPAIGPWVPTASVHIVFLGVAVGLCLLALKDFWLLGGLLLAVAGTVAPNLVHKGWIILVVGLSQLWREPSVSDPTFYLLLAGVHLLYVISSLAAQVPWHGRMQTGALVRPLRRFLLLQTVVQAVSVGALLAFGERRGTVPGLSIFAALVLGVVAASLARGLRQARGHSLPPSLP